MPIKFVDVSYTYSPKTPFLYEALHHVSLSLEDHSFVAIVGKTGCGKSTLIQELNALLLPTKGTIFVDEFVISSKKKERVGSNKDLRKKVGLVFQFPEYQLFEETVEKDVAFGPKNFKIKEEEALQKAHDALRLVGLDESFYKRSPFELSGGERRRVAIAGILSLNPSILVLDEPTAGLDPLGTIEMMKLFQDINNQGTTVILVTHDMNLVLEYASDVVVMDNGDIKLVTDPVSLFNKNYEMYSLETPMLFTLVNKLKEKGMKLDLSRIKDIDSLAKQIAKARKNNE